MASNFLTKENSLALATLNPFSQTMDGQREGKKVSHLRLLSVDMHTHIPPTPRPNIRPRPQPSPDILRTLPRQIHKTTVKHNLIKLTHHKILHPRWFLRRNHIQFILERFTEFIKREIVFISSERVFDFAADGGDAEDDVGADDGAGDGDPAEGVPELEGEHDYVDPCYLGDGDAVGDGEGGIKHAFGAGEDFV